MFRKWGSAAVAVAMIASSATAAYAGSDSQHGALAPAGAAGVHEAQAWDNHTLLLVVGLGIVIGGIALVASTSSGHATATTNTSLTP